MSLIITVHEGPQYHMGKLEIIAERELAARLREAWKLQEGAVYDQSYIDTYIDANGSLLPSGFKRDDVATAVNCPEEARARSQSIHRKQIDERPLQRKGRRQKEALR